MMEFQYQAVNRQGDRISGSLEAADQHQAIGLLNQRGLTVTRIEKTRGQSFSPFSEWAPLSFPLPVLSVFSRQFASLLKAGFDATGALKVLEDQTTNPLLRNAIHRMNAELSTNPKPLAELMTKHRRIFPPLYVNLVAAAETGGFLDRVLLDISDFYDREIEWRRRVSSQTLYGKLTFVVYLLAIAFLVLILPSIGGFRLLSPGFLTLALVVLAVYVAYVVSARTAWGHAFFHGIAVHLPLIGRLYRSISLARFFNIASLQTEAGVPIHDTLNTAARASGDYRVVNSTKRVLSSIDAGSNLNESFRQAGFFTKADVGMVAVGEAAGETGQMMQRVSQYYALDAETQAANLAAFIRVAMPIIMGVLVALVAINFWSNYMSAVMSAGEP